MTTVRRLSDSDVRGIFESLHGGMMPPPPHLQFQIVPVGPNGLKLSPPSYEFEDGLYVLLKPEKKRKGDWQATSASRVPSHLRSLIIKETPPEACQWSLSGPQFPQPTAIQQRYCYPKGDPAYCSLKGGALWTMYDSKGKEDLNFRLLHVYFSAKRASNKGMIGQPMTNASPAMSTPSRRRRQRTLSPWRHTPSSAYFQHHSATVYHTPVPPSPSHHTFIIGPKPPYSPSPYPSQYSEATSRPRKTTAPAIENSNRRSTKEESAKRPSIFVSPITSVSGQDSSRDGLLSRPIHPVASFELEATTSFDDKSTSLEQTGVLKTDSFDLSEAEAEADDDLLLSSLIMSSNTDEDRKKSDQMDVCKVLSRRLSTVQRQLSEWIRKHPKLEQERMNDIVNNWARKVMQRPVVNLKDECSMIQDMAINTAAV